MNSIKRFRRFLRAPAILAAVTGFCSPVAAAIFSNASPINTPNSIEVGPPAVGRATLYPSSITVSGMSGNITHLTVTLNNITHPRPDDYQILLVGPTGKKFVVLADAGGAGAEDALSNVTLTFDDTAASVVPDAGTVTTGSWKPTCIDFQNNIQTEFPTVSGPLDVPTTRGSSTLDLAFGGTNPNGTWSLYVVDDVGSADNGIIAGGWSLNITTSLVTAPTTTTVTSSSNPSFTGGNVTFTATVTSSGNPVTLGSVTFLDGPTIVSSVGLNGSGQATYSTSALTEGSHTITASYGAQTGFAGSQGTVAQTVNTATVVTGNQFCNPGGLNMSASSPGTASAYPSRLFVTGLSGTISKVTVKLDNITTDRPDDIELLLVAPGGQSMILLGDTGGVSPAVSGINLILDDSAASLVPDSGPLVSGTFKPTSVNTSATTFPAPAPAGPYVHPAPFGSGTLANVFNGSAPNGTWALYALDDVNGVGSSIGSWCLTFTTTGDAATTTTVTPSPNPSIAGTSVTFTAQVRRSDNNAAVTTGSVIFREGVTTLGGPTALNGAGQATFSTSALVAGTHTISVDYSGTPGSFNTSTGSTSQQVDTATVVTDNQFCNPGAITVAQSGFLIGDVYPSRVLVQNAGGTITKVTVQLNGISTDRLDDLEVLLVGPAGEKFVLLADAGGVVNSVAGLNLVLDDAGASQVADSAVPVSGTYRPSSYGPATFFTPAPGSPNFSAPQGVATFASIFNGASPNGYWSLYVQDDVDSAQDAIISSWCLTLNTTAGIVCPGDIAVSAVPGTGVSAPVNFAATGSGLPAPTLTYSLGGNPITSPHAFPAGVNVVTATAANGSGAPATCTFTVRVTDVVGRYVFYNQSVWDGNDAAANANDDLAIAPDKNALQPGGTASFANYTSYSRGLNGVMVDIAALPGVPSVSDFIFKAGNDQTPGGWGSAPDPLSVTVRTGAGVNGSDRVTLIWKGNNFDAVVDANEAVAKRWLQVTVKATANTGLAANDVFYFGNAVGETGNSVTDAKVTSADALRVLNNITADAALNNRYDHNRDGVVGGADRLVVLNNLAALQSLVLLDLNVGMSFSGGNAPKSVGAVPASVRWEDGVLRLSLDMEAADGSVRILGADAVDSAVWEPVDVVPVRNPYTGQLEFRLPANPTQPQRFYRLESNLER